MSLARISGIFSNIYRFLYANILCYPCTSYNKKKKEKDAALKKSETQNDIENNMDITAENKTTKVEDEEEEEDEDDEDRVTVPLIFVVGTFGGYILFGSYLFTVYESWSMVEGAYFTYVSLATMGRIHFFYQFFYYLQKKFHLYLIKKGFGDYVPGIGKLISGKAESGTRNLLIVSIYLFIGMAILAMCFSLMQEEFKEKVFLIIAKLGFGPKEDEEEEVEENGGEKSSTEKAAEKEQEANKVQMEGYNLERAASRTSLPPYNENSTLDLRFDKESTVISVKPKIETYETGDSVMYESTAALVNEIKQKSTLNHEDSYLREPLNLMPKLDDEKRKSMPNSPGRVRTSNSLDIEFKRESSEISNRERSNFFMNREPSNIERIKSSAEFNREVTQLFRKKSELTSYSVNHPDKYNVDSSDFFSNDQNPFESGFEIKENKIDSNLFQIKK